MSSDVIFFNGTLVEELCLSSLVALGMASMPIAIFSFAMSGDGCRTRQQPVAAYRGGPDIAELPAEL
jgi:hypothetical protein